MKRLLAISASGLTLAGCNSNAMGFNALSDPGYPWGVFAAGAAVGGAALGILGIIAFFWLTRR